MKIPVSVQIESNSIQHDSPLYTLRETKYHYSTIKNKILEVRLSEDTCILNNFRQILSPWSPCHFSGARGLSFFTGNTCMNPSDAIEAIEKPLSSLPYSLSLTSWNICANSPATNPCLALWGKAGPVNPHSVMHCFRGRSPRSVMFTPAPGKRSASV